MKKIKVTKDIFFSDRKSPEIIPEISCNHNGNKKRFLNHIKKAAEAGANLIKIQSYEANDMTIKTYSKKYLIKNGKWKNKFLWNLYKKTQTPLSWHEDAFKIANDYGKILFSTPFSKRAVDHLEKFDSKIYKVSSFELEDVDLVNYIAQTKKPLIISTGISTVDKIESVVKLIKKYHSNIIILHCVSGYPTKLEDSNLKRITELKKIFKNDLIGLSDHTDNIYTSIACLSLGVCLIEKHFIISKSLRSEDRDFSIDFYQLKKLVDLNKKLYQSLNKKNGENKELLFNKFFKRSIYLTEDVKKNDLVSKKNIKTLRPLIGIEAFNYNKILGKKFKNNLKKNNPVFYRNLK
jgi:pseudaminic acid synthase